MPKAAVISFFLLIGCASGNGNDVYESKKYRYSFSMPDTWVFQEVGSTVEIVPPPESGIRKGDVEVVVGTGELHDCATLEECYKIYVLGRFTDQFEGSVIAEGSTRLSGVDARWLEYRAKHDGVPRMYLVYIVYSPKQLFFIECWSKEGLYSTSKGTFETLAESFRINE